MSAEATMTAPSVSGPEWPASVAQGRPPAKATGAAHQRNRIPAAHIASRRSGAHPSGEKSHVPGSARPVQAAATIPTMLGSYDVRCRTSRPLDGGKLSDKYSAGMPSNSNAARRRSTLRSVEVRQELTQRIEEG